MPDRPTDRATDPGAGSAADGVGGERAAGEPPPAIAEWLGRPVDERMYRYVDLLATAGVERGLIGPREVERLWERHILNCVVLERLVPAGSSLADIGSGAGLPGIVLALVRPDVHVTLVEPLLRRATFLTEAVDQLGLTDQVEVLRVRAEEYAGPRFALVTARAVAPLDRLAALALRLLAPGGTLLAVKGRQAQAELDTHRATLARLGLADVELISVGAPLLAEPTTVVIARADRRPAGRRGRH